MPSETNEYNIKDLPDLAHPSPPDKALGVVETYTSREDWLRDFIADYPGMETDKKLMQLMESFLANRELAQAELDYIQYHVNAWKKSKLH